MVLSGYSGFLYRWKNAALIKPRLLKVVLNTNYQSLWCWQQLQLSGMSQWQNSSMLEYSNMVSSDSSYIIFIAITLPLLLSSSNKHFHPTFLGFYWTAWLCIWSASSTWWVVYFIMWNELKMFDHTFFQYSLQNYFIFGKQLDRNELKCVGALRFFKTFTSFCRNQI